jgi:hypothetical protein
MKIQMIAYLKTSIKVKMKHSSLFLGIFISFFFFVPPLFAEEKIYIFHFKVNGSKDKELESRVRNGMVLSILKNYPGKYKIMDDDSIQDLSKKLQKMQMAGCSEEVCIQELSQAIDAKELISGSITVDGNKIKFDFKKTRKDDLDFSQTLKSQVNEEFENSQLDYFLNESSKKLIEGSYNINRANAPTALSNLEDLAGITNKEKPISELYADSIPLKNKILWEALKEPLEDALELRKNGKTKESADLFLSIYKSVENGLPAESREISPIKETILSRAKGSLLLYYTSRLKDIDISLLKGNISEDSALSKYESLYKNLTEYREDFIPQELPYPILVRIARTYEGIGDRFYRSTQFSPAKENFQKAFFYLEKLTLSDKQKANLLYNTVLSKKNETDTVGKRFVENKIKSLCDTSKAQYSYSYSVRRTRKEDADAALILSKSLLQEAESVLQREKDYISPELQTYYRNTRDAQKY